MPAVRPLVTPVVAIALALAVAAAVYFVVEARQQVRTVSPTVTTALLPPRDGPPNDTGRLP